MSEAVSYGRRVTQLAAQHPDRIAIVHAAADGEEREVSWRELEQRSNQVARLLEERGLGQGAMVTVALTSSPEHCFSTIGAWKLGATVLPMRWDLPTWERERLLELAKPAVVVGAWDDAPPGMLSLDEVKTSTSLDFDLLPDRVPDPVQALATSGSTGTPKLIVAPRQGLFDTGAVPTALNTGSPAERIQLVTSPLYHTNGFLCFPSLLGDAMLVLLERFDAARAVDLIERWRVTYIVMVPTMLQRIARLPDVKERDFSSIEQILYGGAPLAPWVAHAWFDLVGPERFTFSYGGTEGIGLTMTRGDEWLEHEGTVGRPVNCEVRILDEDDDELAAGQIGEIFLRSEDTGPTFSYIGAAMPRRTSDGFSTFGDLGWVDEDGYLYIADRRVDMIITGGANVFPAEIEAALSEHPGVADVVVVGLPDEEWGRRLHAIIEPHDSSAVPTDEELRAHCKERLAPYKSPKSFEFVAKMPRSAAGKINRSALTAERAPSE